MLRRFKDWLGIEGVKVSIDNIAITDKIVTGQLLLKSTTTQFIEHIDIKLEEEYSRGWRKSKRTDNYPLAKKSISLDVPIGAEETKIINFDLSFDKLKSPIDRLGESGTIKSGISKLAKKLNNVKSSFILTAEVKVRGVALSPFTKEIVG